MAEMTAEYSCLFGISTDIHGLTPGDVDVTYDHGRSFLVISGTHHRVFWFFFQKLDKTYTYGSENYPKYSKADAEKVAVENAWRPCHGSLTLGDLWEKRFTYTQVPMEEALFDQWSWGRIATLGDSAHKMTANHGQAGNNAIESAAALANHLKRLRDSGIVTQETIATAFYQWQAKRKLRVEATVKEAAMVCRMQALDSMMAKITVFGLLPYMDEYAPSLFAKVIVGAEVLEYLPMPERALSGTCPFNPTYGAGQHESMLKRAAFASPLLFLSYGIARKTSLHGVESSMLHLLQPASAAEGEWLRAFSSFVDVGLIYALWLIESNRRANSLTIIQFPLLFGILNHLFGPGVVAPCFYFLHHTLGKLENFACADMRLTDMAYTRTILPVILPWMCMPLVLRLMGVPFGISESQRHIVWVLLPLLAISLPQWLIVKIRISKSTEFQDALTNWTRDLPTIRRTIYVLSAISGGAWCYALSRGSLSSVLRLDTSLEWNGAGLLLSSGVWLGLMLNDLRIAGMVELGQLSAIAMCVVAALLGGPAAVIAIGWMMREEILATKQEKHAVTKERYAGKSVEEVEGRRRESLPEEKN